MSSLYLTGIDGSAKLTTPSAADQELPVVEWNLESTAEVVEFINSLTGHFVVNAATYIRARFTIVVDVNPALDCFSLAVGAFVGETIGPVTLWRQKNAGTPTGWYFTTACIESMGERMQRGGKIVQTLNCRGNGAFFRANQTGNFPPEATWPAP